MRYLLQKIVIGTVFTVLLTVLLACVSPSRRPLPPNNPFQKTTPHLQSIFKQGIATGDVTSNSAQIWVRTQVASKVKVTWWYQFAQKELAPASRRQPKSLQIETNADQDFTRTIPLTGLEPGTSYGYQVQAVSHGGQSEMAVKEDVKRGQFSTFPRSEIHTPFKFVWSGDLGGQGQCRTVEEGYRIFDTIRMNKPLFAILLGDLVYADNRCPSPPNIRGSDFIAQSLSEFRAKHRYQREDPSVQRFLSNIPIYASWDDHEVKNNFSGKNEPLMPIGRQAFREYWPIEEQGKDPHRMYRSIRYGADLEIFLLDTRQYRSPNSEQDGPRKTMLGPEQLKWLIAGLTQTSATWKVIVTSVPLGIQKKVYGRVKGNDSWARGKTGTGFYHELQKIVSQFLTHHVSNVVWLSGDVHFAQANTYDPNKDGIIDFYEFIAGPLSAGTRSAPTPQPDLNPTTLYSEGGFTNFGVIQGDQQSLTVQFIDGDGSVRYEHRISANPF